METQSVQIASTVQTKRRKSNQSAVSSKTEQSSSTIDYEKLANEILRQQGKLQAQPTNCSDSHPLNPPPPPQEILPCHARYRQIVQQEELRNKLGPRYQPFYFRF